MAIPFDTDQLLDTELGVYNHGRFVETAQMLSDLAYISISGEEGKIADQQELTLGLQQFRKEALRAGLLEAKDLLRTPAYPGGSAHDAAAKELSLLQQLTGLDGDFILKKLPESGFTGIHSRVFHYRMNLLGLYSLPVQLPFSNAGLAAWTRLKSWFCELDDKRLLYLLGDFNDFVWHIKQCKDFKGQLVYFQHESKVVNAMHYSINSLPVFNQQLATNLNTEGYRNYKRKVRGKKVDYLYIKDQCLSELNQFMIRLLQLNQWIAGYYLGSIDNDLGDLTFESLLNIVQSEVENGNTSFKSQELIGYIGDNYWVVNIHYLLDQMERPVNDKNNYLQLFDQYYSLTSKFSPSEKEQVTMNMNASWKAINQSMNENMKKQNGPVRRVYMGAKNMIRSMLRNFGHFLRRLARQNIDKLNDLKNKAMNLTKLLFKEIREGYLLFKQGLNFLFHRNISTSSDRTLINTHFNFDGDAVVSIQGSLKQEIIEEHHAKCFLKVRGLRLAMRLSGKIIAIIMSAATLNWPLLIIRIGSIYRDEILRSLLQTQHTAALKPFLSTSHRQ